MFDDVNEDNELEENDINPIEDENNIFIKDIVETRLEFLDKMNYYLRKLKRIRRIIHW